MGMAASQARLMSLTARMSDLEFKAQQIQNDKIRLADLGEQASKDYSKALDKETLKVYSGLQSDGTDRYIDASARNLTSYQAVSATDKQRFIKNGSGQVLVTSAVANAYTANSGDVNAFLTALNLSDDGARAYYTNVFDEIQKSGGCQAPGDDHMNSSEWLSGQIQAGNVFLYEQDTDKESTTFGQNVNITWNSGDQSLNMDGDKRDMAKVEANYDATMASIQSKDKRFDLELTSINTEHSAIQTEIDSVKKVIDKNIERSFKTFNG